MSLLTRHAAFRPLPASVIMRIRRLTLLLLILLPAFWLRLFLLDSQSLWWDEGISLHLATSSYGEIAANRVTNIHPPLYFFLLKIWVTLTGVSPFAARYSSVLASFGHLALTYAALRQWFGRRTAAIGLALTAVWAPAIIYAQEIRVYAFLPVIYLLLLYFSQRVVDQPANLNRRSWLWLGLVEWIALHVHYNTLFLILFLNGWLLVKIWPGRLALRHWLLTKIFVGLGSLPWATAVLLNWSAVRAEANLAGFATQPPDWRFVLPQVWGFHLTGLVNVLETPLVRQLSLAGLVCLAALLGWAALGERRTQGWRLLIFWWVPLLLGFSVWLIRSFSHPRYIILFASGMILFLSFLLTPGEMNERQGSPITRVIKNSLRLATAVSFLWLFGWGLTHYFFDPDFAKDDMRSVAGILAETAVDGDLILVPRTDWSLPFTYSGETPIRMADTFHQEQMWPELAVWSRPDSSVFSLDYRDNFYDWQKVVPFALGSAGTLVHRWRIDDLILSQYELDKPISAPELTPRDGRFGDIAFRGSWVLPSTSSSGGVTVALRWQLLAPVTHNYSVVLRVDDGTGLEYAYRDDQLVSANGRLTNRWEVGEEITTYHLLPFTEGTPPLRYEVVMRLYIVEGELRTFDYLDAQGTPQGQDLILGEVEVERPLPGLRNSYGVENPYLPLNDPLILADGLELTHALPDRRQAAPGETVRVRLQWRADASLPDLRPGLVLRQRDQALVINDMLPAQGQFGTHLWQPGDVVLEQRLLTIPATVDPGVATLFIELGETQYPLAEINITAAARIFTPPTPQTALEASFGEVARLVGFDPPPESVPAGQPVPLTLYWESLSSETEVAYAVFAQILAEDGRLVAQHDSAPDNGRRPTTGWVTGEFIQDEHLMTFHEPAFSGQGQIIIGLYNPATGERLRLTDGRDALPLPFTLRVVDE